MSPPLKTAVITGATSGIGRAAAFALAKNGIKVVLLGRREKIGRAVADQIRRYHGKSSATFLSVDLGEPDQVRAVVSAIHAEHTVIDILINNAGARNDQYLCTNNGRELTFACNHLGHFLLTCLLLDCLLAAPAGRIITVSSGNHGTVPTDGCWELSREHYDRRTAYARSKMANIVFASELARRLHTTTVTSNAYEPGGVLSGFARNNGLFCWLRHVLSHVLKKDLVTSAKAAKGIERLACEPSLKRTSGRYVRREINVAALSTFHTLEDAAYLWTISTSLTGLIEPNARTAWRLIKP